MGRKHLRLQIVAGRVRRADPGHREQPCERLELQPRERQAERQQGSHFALEVKDPDDALPHGAAASSAMGPPAADRDQR